MGHPSYEVTEGEILQIWRNVLEMEVDERARAGLIAMQYPSEIVGVTNVEFMFSYQCTPCGRRQSGKVREFHQEIR